MPKPLKYLTLGFVVEGDRVLLGMKKRGFGAGRWNGFGGKIEAGESAEEAMIREFREECGLAVSKVEKYATIVFRLDSEDSDLQTELYRVTKYSGTPIETEEMEPRWFSVGELPFSQMWPDDIYWFPLFLEGKKFTATFDFVDQNVIKDYKIILV